MTKNMHYISRGFIVSLILCLPLHSEAQRRGIVISADTKLPLRDVAIRWDNKDVTKSAWDGTFEIPSNFKKVNFWHPKCEGRSLKHEEMTDTIYLLPSSRMLAEVVIYGNRGKKREYTGQTSVDKQLIAAQTTGGANLLGVIKLLAQPVLNKIQRNKMLKKARKKQILDNY